MYRQKTQKEISIPLMPKSTNIIEKSISENNLFNNTTLSINNLISQNKQLKQFIVSNKEEVNFFYLKNDRIDPYYPKIMVGLLIIRNL